MISILIVAVEIKLSMPKNSVQTIEAIPPKPRVDVQFVDQLNNDQEDFLNSFPSEEDNEPNI